MKTALFLACAMAALAISCGSDGKKTSATSTAPAIPRTGIRTVDSAVDTVLSGNRAQLKQFIRYTPTACAAVPPQGIGAPPKCSEGEADGSLVDVLPIAACEGEFVRAGDVDLSAVPVTDLALYAVYRAPADVFPPGAYYVIFSARGLDGAAANRGFALAMTDSGLTGIRYGCGDTPSSLIATARLTDAIIPPK